MQQPLQLTYRGIESSEAIEQRIRGKAEELERFYDGIVSCHVTVEAPHQQHQKGNLFLVRIDLHVPGKEIVVGNEHRHHHAHEDVHVAIRDAFAAAKRQLEDYARKRRRRVKRHEEPLHGHVGKLFPDQGYGFVQLPDGTDIYFHQNAVANGGFAALSPGDRARVVIAEGEGDKGPQASAVFPLK